LPKSIRDAAMHRDSHEQLVLEPTPPAIKSRPKKGMRLGVSRINFSLKNPKVHYPTHDFESFGITMILLKVATVFILIKFLINIKTISNNTSRNFFNLVKIRSSLWDHHVDLALQRKQDIKLIIYNN
jgi:hypothetical protein